MRYIEELHFALLERFRKKHGKPESSRDHRALTSVYIILYPFSYFALKQMERHIIKCNIDVQRRVSIIFCLKYFFSVLGLNNLAIYILI